MAEITLDAFTPVAPPRSAPTLSIPERAIRRARNKSNQQPANPHAMIHERAKKLNARGQYRKPLTVQEQVGMASTLVAEFFEEALEQRAAGGRLTAAKHAATAWAIAMDKLALASQGKPQLAGALSPQRAGLRQLVQRLAAAEASDADKPASVR